MSANHKKLISLRINNNLYESLKKEAVNSNRSFNNYIETILLDTIKFSERNNTSGIKNTCSK